MKSPRVPDVLLYTVLLASVRKVDLNAAVGDKLKTNAAKYPAEKSHGSNKKYMDL